MNAESSRWVTGPSMESAAGGARKTGLSCAECRRSKLKCDREFPCQSCIRRGCANICPEGTLSATKGNKVLVAHTQRLSGQVKSMKARIKELEEALHESQKANYGGSEPLSLVRAPSQSQERVRLPELRTIFDEEVRDVSESIGALSIDVDGRAKYHGESLGSEFQQLFPTQPSVPTDPKYLGLPFEIIDLCSAYPFGLRDSQYTKYLFLPFLPPRERALQLTELYYQNVAWMSDPIIRDDFMTNILTPLYGHTGSPNINSVHSHRLSVFFILLASGVLYEHSPSSGVIAEQYHALSRAALSLDPIYQDATCATVQALFITVRYIYQTDCTNNESRWLLMGVVARVAQLIGLQRDSEGWGLGHDETQRRRILFWEIYTWDAWTSIANGRPPALSINHTDCWFPEDLKSVTKPSGVVEMGWHVWKFRYTASCLGISVQHVFNTRVPSYSALLELDLKIRKFNLPSHLQSPMEASEAGRAWSSEAPRAMQQYCVLFDKEANLLYIHRSWFAQAIRESPDNPLQHKYAPSVLAVYRSACRLISGLKGLYRVHPYPTSRTWFFWSSVFAACILLGSIVVDSPRCMLASNALQELDQAMTLYEQGSRPCRPPATMLVLQRLRERATNAFDVAQRDARQTSRSSFHYSDPEEVGGQKSVTTSLSPVSPALSAFSLDRLSEPSDDFARQLDPSIVHYYRALADPGFVLPATGELDLDNIPPAQPLAQYDATSPEDLSTPSPFFDPSLQVTMMNQSTHPTQNIAGPSASVPQQQLSYQQPQHPYFFETDEPEIILRKSGKTKLTRWEQWKP
ncbi:hypothetical protein K503DRAFT_54027 [Rhizopogon vinicolor AM-OR11-026]|uniref:Zn(2)-C6 fungal-type domain-containing protein n=1 Tax=Rhizopogon vinicolor AM-OR11-026 TaxID=1314800 RepID=A0A1B7N4P6_9AGAM|nr:hypothetical protein K503DRAFT_54027 [Rhizopogon vinicolor AM-OR11-026]